MTYLDDEKAGLDPIEFYEFTFGAAVWRFCDSDASYVNPANGSIYAGEPISRGRMNQSGEDDSMSVDIVLDALNPVANFFRTPFLPVQQIWLTIWRSHIGSAFYSVLFRGRVGQCVFEGTTARVTCIPMRAALNKQIPIQLVQTLCNNTLYDARCKLNPEDFKETGSITDIDGLTLTVSWDSRVGRPTGWLDGGYITKVGYPSATILTDILGPPDTVKILYNPGYLIGDVFTAFAGCDKKFETCRIKFNNTLHHQGFNNFPIQDPFANEVL